MLEGPIELTMTGKDDTLLAYRKRYEDGEYGYATVGAAFMDEHGITEDDIEGRIDAAEGEQDPEFREMCEGLFEAFGGDDDDELKSCPFCDGDDLELDVSLVEHGSEADGIPEWWGASVYCRGCGVQVVASGTTEHKARGMVVRKWNARGKEPSDELECPHCGWWGVVDDLKSGYAFPRYCPRCGKELPEEGCCSGDGGFTPFEQRTGKRPERVPECPFDEAFLWAMRYNGWERHVDAMIEYIEHNVDDHGGDGRYLQVTFPGERSVCVTRDDVHDDNPNSFLWMVLVQMFGDYGTSPRYGWIKHPYECVEYLRRLRRRTYGYDHFVNDDGSFRFWETSDDEYAELAAEFERENRRERE